MSLVTIMQLSDIHKNISAFDSSNALISSIVSDFARYQNEEPPVSRPNILIVCGDIIQGSGSSVDFDSSILEIEQQYKEAHDFLSQLCKKLFDGDKKRIVLIPGNHDVSWPHSQKSMEKLDMKKLEVEKLEMEKLGKETNLSYLRRNPESGIRWNWKDHSYYKIENKDLYNNRFLPFANFYSTFYSTNRQYSLKPEEQYDVFEFPEYKLLFVGFNSCYLNDHLNDIGRIHPDCMANCHFSINQEKYEDWLKIAIWHHGVHGFPSRSDYMDEGTVQFLIDKGFKLGFHGHQHKSDIFEVKFNVDRSFEMQIFGAGTLCAQDIPQGETKQYSIIQLDNSFNKIKYHVRKAIETTNGLPIWMPGNIKHNKDRSYMERDITINMYKDKEQKMQSESESLKKLAEAEDLVAKKEYLPALIKLNLLDQEKPFVRTLKIECLSQLKKDEENIQFIKEPNTLEEFTYLSEALWRKKKIPDLRVLLDKFSKNKEIATSEAFKRMNSKLKDRGN